MDIFSTTLEAIKLAHTLYEKCSDYRDADQTIKNIRIRLESVEIRLELFREYFKLSESATHHDSIRARDFIKRSVENVEGLLVELQEKLPPSSTASVKIAWVGWGKRRAERLLGELKEWDYETIHNVLAYGIHSGLRNHDYLYERLFKSGDRTLTGVWSLNQRIRSSDTVPFSFDLVKIPLSSIDPCPTHDSRMLAKFKSDTVYIECHYLHKNGNEGKEKQSFERLAYVFSSLDLPSIHLLPAVALAEDYDSDRCFLIYNLPADAEPSNLTHIPTLALALEHEARIKLEDRFRIALEIATAVFEIHTAGWVHKAVRSDNVLINVDSGPLQQGVKTDAAVGPAYLVGFEASRPIIEGSEGRPEMDPVKRLYQHPERQGGRDVMIQKFGIRHDMYSLGAVLIEIGYRKTLRSIFKFSATTSLRRPTRGEAEDTHRRLIDYAQRLGDKMGSKYAAAAYSCLTKTTERGRSSASLREELYQDVLRPLKEISDVLKVSSFYSYLLVYSQHVCLYSFASLSFQVRLD